tara:strand:- start:51 stop:299 length:249 start_codon:yes stop_codon:yes gene_type:complete
MDIEDKYKHPHFIGLITVQLIIMIIAFITQSCMTTAQLYVDPRYKIQPVQGRAYPEINVGVKFNVGPKITFKKKGEINSPSN